MVEFFAKTLSAIFGNNSWFATLIVSMFPIFELKGAIPVGMSREFWGENALNGTQAFICSLIGSCLVVPILAVIFKPIVHWMKNTKIFKNIAVFLDDKIGKSTRKIEVKSALSKSKNKTLLKCLGVFTFVAIPLPLTGVWTGTCVGVMLGLNFFQTVISVVLGNILAGVVITCVCSVFPQLTTILFFAVLVIIIGIVISMIVKHILSKNRKNPM